MVLAKTVEKRLSMARLEHTSQKAIYRRGTIMGLTAAEAFMLICFILLMLLMLWRAEAEEDVRIVEEFASNFTEKEKKLALAYKDRLAKLDAALEDIEMMRPLLETPGITAEKVAAAMELLDRFGTLDPDLIDDRLRLVADEDIRRAAEAMQKVDKEELLKLVDMVEAGKMRNVLKAAELEATPDEVEKPRAQNEEMANAKETLERIQQLGFSTDDVAALEERLRQLIAVEKQQARLKPHEWPPIINLSEAGGYFFKSGSAELTEAFISKLRGSIAAQIAQSLDQYDVDVIEVIGHTDEQPVSRTKSNLDSAIIGVVDGRTPITSILPADNAGLGMARALAVVIVLKSDERLSGATILPMSGAQLILPGDMLTAGQPGDVEARRRIEIRIRRRNDG